MTLRIHNTLTRTKEDFVPLDAKNVRMYVCGPTVYDFAHIGNARPVIVFDVLFRLLRHLYGEAHVTYVRNITDIDDKINARAGERGISIRELTDETCKQYSDDVAALGCLPPTYEPRATDHIEEMKEIVERLISSEHAYVKNEHVLFNVPSMLEYGELSKRPLDEMIAGARVDVAPYKRSPMDFVLWKPSDQRQTNYRIPAWPSPHKIETPGRPGWHLECSAMAWKFLKETFDIHGGGIDLVFPHHENEIAQSRCAFHTSFMAKYWMHNGFLNVEGDKMSKSLGNFVTIRELLETEAFGGRSWSGGVLRFTMLKTHYRQPIDWTVNSLEESHKELQAWASALTNTKGMYHSIGRRSLGREPQPPEEIIEALSDDLNLPSVIAHLRRIFSRLRNGDEAASVALMETSEFLGLLRADMLFAYNPYHVGSGERLVPQPLRHLLDEIQVAMLNQNDERRLDLIEKLRINGVTVTTHENGAVGYKVVGGIDVEAFINARNAARKVKDFKEADRIRDELLAQGIVLKDNADGTTTPEVKR